MVCSDGVVPCAVPPLPLSKSHPKCPRFPLNPQHQISINPLQPHIPTSNQVTSWLTPYGIARMHTKSSYYPPEIIVQGCLVIAHCVLPNTLKNYASSLTQFMKFCDDF